MSALRIFLTAGTLLLPAAGFAARAQEPGAEPRVPQNHCFCIQYTSGFPSPYYLGKLNPPTPECADMKHVPDGKPIQESGLLACDALRGCAKGSAQYLEKKKILAGKTSQVREQLAGCCVAGREVKGAAPQCDAKCTGDWEGIIKVLAAETEKLDKQEQEARERCFAKSAKKIKKTAKGKAGPK